MMKSIPTHPTPRGHQPTARLAALTQFAGLAYTGPGFAANLVVNTLNDTDAEDVFCSLRIAHT